MKTFIIGFVVGAIVGAVARLASAYLDVIRDYLKRGGGLSGGR